LLGNAFAAGFNEAMEKQKDLDPSKNFYYPKNRSLPNLYWSIESMAELNKDFIDLKNDKGESIGRVNIAHAWAYQKVIDNLLLISKLRVKVAYIPGGPPDAFTVEVDGQNLILINLEMLDVLTVIRTSSLL